MLNSLLAACNAFKEAVTSTFIVDNRYQIFLTGIQNTLLITVGALAVGVVLGVLVAITRVYYLQYGPYSFWKSLGRFLKTGRIEYLSQALQKLVNVFLGAYLTVFRGTPVVVQLMIWAFVVFSRTNELVVAIIGFGINSGAYVAEIVRAGIMAVDKGQTEASRSLGLSGLATMRLIVLPQAFKNILPALGNEIIALVKETSIAGYIAVTDLTKAASLVRARTFDAFVPLLFVAAVYLLMVLLLTAVQQKIEKAMRTGDRR
jgi:His/Glu/Gln/Arg/opine family amino acid ABC transporter permease subunit